jgi:hypothetical protein
VTLSLAGRPFTLPLLASAADVRWALLTLKDAAGLPVLPPASVAVTRAATIEGYKWRVTFLGSAAAALGSGNVPLMQLLAPLPAAHTDTSNSASNCGRASPGAPFAGCAGPTCYDNSCIGVAVAAEAGGAAAVATVSDDIGNARCAVQLGTGEWNVPAPASSAGAAAASLLCECAEFGAHDLRDGVRFQVLVNRVDWLPDGRPVQSFVARRVV